MVRLTRAVVLQGISKVCVDKKDTIEIEKEFCRITHLHLQQKGLTSLESLHLFGNLCALYLYENELTSIQGLEHAHNLEILQLQRNRIQQISNLQGCMKLRKLYLGYNEIETVEGLEKLHKLEELYLENQRLQNGMSLAFDPKTLANLCNCLVQLNISGNRITQLEDLAGMKQLRNLVAGDNPIGDLESTALVVRTLYSLQSLDLRDTPVSKRPHFKERIVGFGHNIVFLNEKEIPDSCRNFIKKFTEVKASRLEQTVKAFEKRKRAAYGEESLGGSQATLAGGDDFGASSKNQDGGTKSNLSLHMPWSTEGGDEAVGLFQKPCSDKTLSKTSSLNISSPNSIEDLRTAEESVNRNPQFILAPPGFSEAMKNQSDSNFAGVVGGNMRSKGRSQRGHRTAAASSSKGNPSSVLTPDFKQLWSGRNNLTEGREILKIVKPLGSGKRLGSCSKHNVEGIPMPSSSLLRFDDTRGPGFEPRNASSDSRLLQPVVTSKHVETVERPRGGRKTPTAQLQGSVKPFSESVYEFPPWPHIEEHLSVTVKPSRTATFMP